MDIKFSRYNAPFAEKPLPGVHFISLDDQRLMRSGHLIAHVEAYQAEKYRFHRVFAPNHVPFKPYNDSPEPDQDSSYLCDLYHVHGIRAAGKRAGRCR